MRWGIEAANSFSVGFSSVAMNLVQSSLFGGACDRAEPAASAYFFIAISLLGVSSPTI
jgi:hypothetical protein